MRHPADRIVSEDRTSTITARIDAQEDSFVRPIREYLETNGCSVVLNPETDIPSDYHIVAGDLAYVKTIFSLRRLHGIKRLGILVGAGRAEDLGIDDPWTKLLCVDPVELTSDDTERLFEFFFVGRERVVDKRRSIHVEFPSETPSKLTAQGVQQGQGDAFLLQNDQLRVGQIMKDVFGESSSTRLHKRGRKPKRQYVWRYIAVAALVIVIPVFWYLVSLTASAGALAYSMRALIQGKTKQAVRFSHVSTYWVHQGRFVLGVARPIAVAVGAGDAIRHQERTLSFIENLIAAGKDLYALIEGSSAFASVIVPSGGDTEGQTPAATVERMRVEIASLENNLGLALAQATNLLGDKHFPFSIALVRRFCERTEEQLDSLRRMVTTASGLFALYPQIAGYKEPKRYLVLLQNSMELRPTGGFIGSLGLITFADGKMTEFAIQDVYEVDGQLKGHVDPPAPIGELLAQEHWYLRDSNWDPDFKVSGQRAAWFYEKETGTRVHGVIAVSTPLVVDLLSATGPIELADYNDRISAENFFGKSLFYTQENFFPGSTQKKDFLGSLARTLITKLTTDTASNSIAVLRAFVSALERKNIQFMFEDPSVQSLVERFGWAGRHVLSAACTAREGAECVSDPLSIVEANMGVNKVNYFVTRAIEREITIDANGGISERVLVRFRNAAPTGDTPLVGSAYQAYVRFALPPQTLPQDVAINGVSIPSRDSKKKHLPAVPYVERADEGGDTFTLGVALTVPAGSDTTLQFSYRRDKPLVFTAGGAHMEIIERKQPGVEDTPLRITIRFPPFWREANTVVAKDGELSYNTTLSSDVIAPVTLVK